MTTQIAEISQKDYEEIIKRLVSGLNQTIANTKQGFKEMEEQGETVSGFIYSFVTDDEDKIEGVNFCKGKTIKELRMHLEEPKTVENSYKDIQDTETYATAIVNDPAYRNSNFRRGIELYLKEVEKL